MTMGMVGVAPVAANADWAQATAMSLAFAVASIPEGTILVPNDPESE